MTSQIPLEPIQVSYPPQTTLVQAENPIIPGQETVGMTQNYAIPNGIPQDQAVPNGVGNGFINGVVDIKPNASNLANPEGAVDVKCNASSPLDGPQQPSQPSSESHMVDISHYLSHWFLILLRGYTTYCFFVAMVTLLIIGMSLELSLFFNFFATSPGAGSLALQMFVCLLISILFSIFVSIAWEATYDNWHGSEQITIRKLWEAFGWNQQVCDFLDVVAQFLLIAGQYFVPIIVAAILCKGSIPLGFSIWIATSCLCALVIILFRILLEFLWGIFQFLRDLFTWKWERSFMLRQKLRSEGYKIIRAQRTFVTGRVTRLWGCFWIWESAPYGSFVAWFAVGVAGILIFTLVMTSLNLSYWWVFAEVVYIFYMIVAWGWCRFWSPAMKLLRRAEQRKQVHEGRLGENQDSYRTLKHDYTSLRFWVASNTALGKGEVGDASLTTSDTKVANALRAKDVNGIWGGTVSKYFSSHHGYIRLAAVIITVLLIAASIWSCVTLALGGIVWAAAVNLYLALPFILVMITWLVFTAKPEFARQLDSYETADLAYAEEQNKLVQESDVLPEDTGVVTVIPQPSENTSAPTRHDAAARYANTDNLEAGHPLQHDLEPPTPPPILIQFRKIYLAILLTCLVALPVLGALIFIIYWLSTNATVAGSALTAALGIIYIVVAAIIVLILVKVERGFPLTTFLVSFILLMIVFLATYATSVTYVQNPGGSVPLAADPGPPIPPSAHPYYVCDANSLDITTLDFAYASFLAYADFTTENNQTSSALAIDFPRFFPPQYGWTLGQVYDSPTLQFFEIQRNRGGGAKPVSMFAVRGTSDAVGVIADLDLWSQIALWQVVGLFIPTVSIWPTEFIQYLVKFSSLTYWLGSATTSELVYQPLLQAVQKAQANGRDVVSTGHSLGGGLAAIVSGIQQIDTVGISSPGIRYSSLKFGIDDKDVNMDALQSTVYREGDIVPQIDNHYGNTQQLPCPERSSNPILCHSIAGTVRELSLSCGDPYGRRFLN